ncbi:MAG TPA: TIR domain-containing protein [Kofleriaceae bacterium]|nr:TIR domain-containing protein [Kofleriaceae bacterium]
MDLPHVVHSESNEIVAEPLANTSLNPATYAYDLFVVYAADDTDFVHGYLLPALNLASARVLLIDALLIGGVVISEFERGVTNSRFTVAVLSPAYLTDRWALFGEQIASHLSAKDTRVIPLRLWDCQIPLRLDARVSLDFTDRTRWDTEVARLRNLLHTTAPAEEPIPCPYPGMRPFAETDVSRFFGRDQEIDDLIGRIDRGEHEIYVIGPSGSGKSSLVYAGLLPVLDAGSSRLERSFVVRAMRPGERPTDRLAKALEGDLAMPASTIEALVDRNPPATRALILVDQFEELFTLASSAERQRFIAVLRRLRSVSWCYLLLALRADFFGALLDSELGPDLAMRVSPLVVAPLKGAALARAIREPAIRAGAYVEARLCDRLVRDAAEEPGALPLVQETLRLLWDRRRQRLLGLAEYDAIGHGERGLDVAIARRADTAMSILTAKQQAIARRILLRLVSFGEGRADTRRQQPIQALQSATDDGAEFSRVLQLLVENRLVTVDRAEADDDVLADLAHEALITGWPALRAWVETRRVDEQRRRRLEAKLAEWTERGRGQASLLDPVELSEAVQWMQSDAARDLGCGTELLALLAASRNEIERVDLQRRQRTFRAFTVLATFSVITSILGLIAWRQRQDALKMGETAQERLAMSYLEQGRGLLLDGHPMQALPYLVAARNEGMESPILQMLYAEASRNVPHITLIGHTSYITAAEFSSDGTRVVTASDDNAARVWDANTGRPVTAPLKHQGTVLEAKFSTDGTRVVTASGDKTARIWNATTGMPVTRPLEHGDTVSGAAFNLDGTMVVTTSYDKTARIWDAKTGNLLTPPLEHNDVVTAATFSLDSTRVVTASADKTAQIWDTMTGKPVTPPLEHHGTVLSAVFSADGTRVVTASYDNTAQVWSATTGKPMIAPLDHRATVTEAAFSPDGTRVVTASSDKTARVWDATTGKPVTAPLKHRGIVLRAAFSPDGKRVVTASYDNTARVWDSTTGRPVTAPLEHQSSVFTAKFSPDGTRVVTASYDNTARVWDVSTDKLVTVRFEQRDTSLVSAFDFAGTQAGTTSYAKMAQVWNGPSGKPVNAPLERHDIIPVASFSPDGTRVVTASRDGTARVWNARSGKLVIPPLEHQDIVTAASFSADGMRVVTASGDATAQVWDATTGQPVTPPLQHHDIVTAASFSADGTRVITASYDRTARVWDAKTGKPVSPPLEHPDIVTVAVFSADGTRVVTASGGKMARIWNATTGEPITPALEHQGLVFAAAFSADGTRVVTASRDKTVRIWDAKTGAPVIAPLEHQGFITAAGFNPDGTKVVTASTDRAARVWDVKTGKLVIPPLEHQGIVYAAAFSSDGTRVVTASEDKTARVWDARTGKPVTEPLEHSGIVRVAVFSPDDIRVVTMSEDGTARVWMLPIHAGSIEDWKLLTRCSPFAFNNGVVVANRESLSVCTTLETSL